MDNKIKIGIIKEGKVPIDRRVPITPAQAQQLQENYPQVEVLVQSSEIRCFTDQEYADLGINVVESVADCDILMGVKEVPVDQLVADKTYFFFSHTIKKQEYNLKLIRKVIEKKIRLIDYEVLTNEEGVRLVAFGRYAGIVGAYNGIWTFGKRYNLFHLRRAHECFDLEDLKTEYSKVKLPPVKIVLTGGGRVSKGAMEVLNGMGIRKVSPHELLTHDYHEPVYAQLNSRDYHQQKDGAEFSRTEFYAHPENYKSDFHRFACVSDMLIAGAYWDPQAPVLFTRHDVLQDDFKIKVVADITCDIDGSIPSTKKPSTIDDPIYDYDPSEDSIEQPLRDEANITVMAVDNLPCELPRNASEDFGKELINNVLPSLIETDDRKIIHRATIAEGGAVTDQFAYLRDWVAG